MYIYSLVTVTYYSSATTDGFGLCAKRTTWVYGPELVMRMRINDFRTKGGWLAWGVCSRALSIPDSLHTQTAQETAAAMKSILFLVASLALVLADGQVPVVKLADGPSQTKGRVEITLGDSAPRQVCSSDFESDDTDALCKAAGFADSTASTTDYGVKGGLEFIKVECSDATCTYRNEPSGYSCPETVLGLDCSPKLGVTGSIGLEAGIIAGILVTLVAVIAIALGLSVCLYRNDLIPCLQNAATSS